MGIAVQIAQAARSDGYQCPAGSSIIWATGDGSHLSATLSPASPSPCQFRPRRPAAAVELRALAAAEIHAAPALCGIGGDGFGRHCEARGGRRLPEQRG